MLSRMKHLLVFFTFFIMSAYARAQDRKYGPLLVDFENARRSNSSIIIPARNQKGQSLFIGVYCKNRLFNFTGAEGQWKDWEIPVNIYEAKIVADVCNQI